jgi:cell wall assembly regulator SMI1
MKILLVALVALFSIFCQAQEQIQFTYDAAGNQLRRELICITCNDPAGRPNPNALADTDLIKSSEYEQLSYYPNPVLEQLYIKWGNEDNSYVTGLEVYSMAGQLVSSKQKLQDSDNTTVEFQNLAQGIYNVILVYNNGEKKVLKVIKK